jgi:hypothetical protein
VDSGGIKILVFKDLFLFKLYTRVYYFIIIHFYTRVYNFLLILLNPYTIPIKKDRPAFINTTSIFTEVPAAETRKTPIFALFRPGQNFVKKHSKKASKTQELPFITHKKDQEKTE